MNKRAKVEPAELHAIFEAAHAAETQVETRLSEIGLSLPKFLALKALADAGESLPLGQLAGRLSCVKSNITQLVDRLEADGLVARKPDPGDRRSRLAALTPAGRRACQAGSRVQQDSERQLLGSLTAEEARHLVALLGKVGSTR